MCYQQNVVEIDVNFKAGMREGMSFERRLSENNEDEQGKKSFNLFQVW